MLWFNTSGRASNTVCSAASEPPRSLIRVSTRAAGSRSRTASTVAATAAAPPSSRSSRATMVTTTCSKPIRAAASATRSGSPTSGGPGRRVSTRQNPQARVQRSPRIMKVAVPSFQHSEMLGQPASSHTVTKSRSRRVERTRRKAGPVSRRTFIHSGLRDRKAI